MHPDAGFWRGRPVAVTGGTGFLGWHIIRRLAVLGARVRAFALLPQPDHPIFDTVRRDRDRRHLPAGGCPPALAGLRHRLPRGGRCRRLGPGTVGHGRGSPPGHGQCLAAAMPAARIVHVSSIVAVGATVGGGIAG